MLLLYTSEITPRIQYTFNLLFRDVLGIEFHITTDKEEFKKFSNVKINYSNERFADELFFQSTKLLFETGIKSYEISQDIFADTFFLTTRYEEYLPFEGDKYGRYSSTLSAAHKMGFLRSPVVNIWAEDIKRKITGKFSGFKFPDRKYKFITTIDIDNAYAYLEKGKWRTAGGYARAYLKLDKAELSERKNVSSGNVKDPYDTYDLILDVQRKYNLNSIFFFLLADYAPHDKNVPHSSKKFQSLIKSIKQISEIGIHASFASNTNPKNVTIEKQRLERILGTPIVKNRQHFLMLKFPDTYRNLIVSGITEDYSMGYADQIGFRAGICTPYKFYDIKTEQETQLTIYPFAVMDGTLNRYMKLNPQDALRMVKPVIQEIKNVNGDFILLWHNESLSERQEWKGWKDVYEEIVTLAL